MMNECAEEQVAPTKHSYTIGEEVANAITHGLGSVLSVVALALLVITGLRSGDIYRLVSGIIYGASLVLLYTCSTLYHSIPWPRAKYVFKILDHAGIYALIAGTYTPFCLVTLRPTVGWWMFILLWTFAAIGIAAEAFWVYRPKWLSAVVYLFMGWIVIIAIKPMIAALPPTALWLLIAGGLFYTVGAITYIPRRVPYLHAVWHLFVLGGSICHFLAVILYVM